MSVVEKTACGGCASPSRRGERDRCNFTSPNQNRDFAGAPLLLYTVEEQSVFKKPFCVQLPQYPLCKITSAFRKPFPCFPDMSTLIMGRTEITEPSLRQVKIGTLQDLPCFPPAAVYLLASCTSGRHDPDFHEL